MKTLKRWMASVALVAFVGAIGCGKTDKKLTIHGTVTYKGEAITSGNLRFLGEHGAFATAPIHPDGTFDITDVEPGEVKVGFMPGPQGSGSSDEKPGAKHATKKAPPVVPNKYFEPASSGLKYTITSDTKVLAIEMQ